MAFSHKTGPMFLLQKFHQKYLHGHPMYTHDDSYLIILLNYRHDMYTGLCWCRCGLGCRFTAAPLLGTRVRIPLKKLKFLLSVFAEQRKATKKFVMFFCRDQLTEIERT
jgi:hypothetical protein